MLVFTIGDDTDHLPTMSHPKYPNIESITLSIKGVEKLIDNINIHKASGPDKRPNIILKSVLRKYLQHWLTFYNKVFILVLYQMTGEIQI